MYCIQCGANNPEYANFCGGCGSRLDKAANAPVEKAAEASPSQPRTLRVPFIDKLDFGMDSSETDQAFLAKVFLYTSLFDRIKSGKKHLVLGRKGAGKTGSVLNYTTISEGRELASA